MLPFFTYVLRCSDGSYYVGHTDELERRIGEHHHGEIPGYTATRRPVELVWSQEFPDRDSAFAAERQLKGWSRAKKQALIAGDWALVRSLASRAQVLRDADGSSSGSAPSAPQDERGWKADGSSTSSTPPSPQDERDWGNAQVPTPAHPEERLSEGEGASRRTREAPLRNPIIVLVRPQLGENIGKAARAMLNFGLTDMRLVAPRDGWPNPSAGPAAAGADVVLERAEVFDTLAEAVADCAHVYATTVRKRGVTKPVLTPEQAAQAIHREAGRSAIVFGPERSGLETEEVALARAIVTVPINPEFASLNLAQAVILCAYEWSKHLPSSADGSAGLAQPTVEELLPPAPQEELEGLIAHFETLLEEREYFFPPSRAAATRRTLRNVLTKPGWNHLEVRTLRGVLSQLERPPGSRKR